MEPATASPPLPQRRPLPRELSFLAALFLLGGLWSSFLIIRNFINGAQAGIDLGIFGLPIFYGLRTSQSGWRTVALVFAWLFMLWATLQTVIGLVAWTLVPIKSLELTPESPLSLAAFFGRNLLIFLAAFWTYRVLTRPEIRRCFLL